MFDMTDSQFNTNRNDLIQLVEEITKQTITNKEECARLIDKLEALKK